jgi:hypothetical protein
MKGHVRRDWCSKHCGAGHSNDRLESTNRSCAKDVIMLSMLQDFLGNFDGFEDDRRLSNDHLAVHGCRHEKRRMKSEQKIAKDAKRIQKRKRNTKPR